MTDQFSFTSNHRHTLVVIVIVAVAFYLVNFSSFQVGSYQDDATYIILAQSIVAGQGLARINFPVPKPETAWPVGYPLLLSPLVAAWPFNFTVLKLSSVVLMAASVLLVYQFVEPRLGQSHALIVVALYALNIRIVRHASMVMSEVAYLVWSVLALHLVQRYERESYQKWYQLPLVAVTMVAVFTTRLVGISLPLAFLLYTLVRGDLRSALIVGVVCALGATPQLLISKAGAGELLPPEATAQVTVWSHFEVVLPNILAYAFDLMPQVVFGLFGPTTATLASHLDILWVVWATKLGLLALVFLGFVRALRTRLAVSEVYFVVYMGVLATRKWLPDRPNALMRYLIPMLPLLYLYLVQGLDCSGLWLSHSLRRSRFRYVAILIVVVPVLLIHGIRDVTNVIYPIRERITDVGAGAAWIAANAPAEAVVMCRNPEARYVHARRSTIGFPSKRDERSVLEYITHNGVSHILIAPEVHGSPQLDSYQSKLLSSILKHQPGRFKLVYEDPENQVEVYQVEQTEEVSALLTISDEQLCR